MNKPWLVTILCLSFGLLAVFKTQEVKSLKTFYASTKVIRLASFQEAKTGSSPEDQDLIELWESMLTGRSAPLSKMMKQSYKALGLQHLFTPSGFHLSAVLYPFLKVLKTRSHHLLVLLLLGAALLFVPGQNALKRMVSIKASQKLFGLKTGFVLALVIDCCLGSFQTSGLSFTYSFLFLGVIYSGLAGLGLVIWIYLAQMLLAYFHEAPISLAVLFLSPVLNLAFAFAMPVLFLLAIPLAQWQLGLGLSILRQLQWLVDEAAVVSTALPAFEVNFGMLLLLSLVVMRKWKLAGLVLVIFCNSLNLDLQRPGSLGTYDYKPTGAYVETVEKGDRLTAVFEDGKCDLRLIRGYWWETCSPRRRSRKKL